MSSQRLKSEAADFESLAANALAQKPAVRPALLVALTDLFVSRECPDGEEIARYEDMALRLIADADSSVRAHVAARLSQSRFAPVSLLDALLHGDQVSATILLEHSDRLPAGLLEEIARTGSSAEARILARRDRLDAALADILSQRSDASILCALAENRSIALAGDTLKRLLEAARSSDELARLICARFSDPHIVTPLFLNASPEQRDQILRDAEFENYTGAQIHRVKIASETMIDWIIARGRQGHWGLVAQEIGRITGVERHAIERLLADERGDGLAVLLSAIGCPVEKAISLFLKCPPAISHSYPRVKALAEVVETMPAHAAYRIIDSIAGRRSETQRPARHVPLADPTASPTPSRARGGLAQRPTVWRNGRENIRLLG